MRITSLPQGSSFGRAFAEFFSRNYYSVWVLAAGATSYGFFANTEAANLRNYNFTQNFLKNSQGRILGLQAEILSAGFGAVSYAFTGGVALANAIAQMVNQMEIEIVQDAQPIDYVLMRDLIPVPALTMPEATGAPTNLYAPAPTMQPSNPGGGIWRDNAQKWIKSYQPPIEVPRTSTIEFRAKLPSGISIPPALNGYYLALYAACEDIPQGNAQVARV